MAQASTDEMLHTLAVCGDARRAFEQIRKRQAEESLPRDLVYVAPPSFLTSERRRALYARNSLALISEFS